MNGKSKHRLQSSSSTSQEEGLHLNPYDICPDRITARQAFTELSTKYPNREWRLVEINVPYQECQAYTNRVSTLAYPSDTVMDLVCFTMIDNRVSRLRFGLQHVGMV
jgi:hypothetical protein